MSWLVNKPTDKQKTKVRAVVVLYAVALCSSSTQGVCYDDQLRIPPPLRGCFLQRTTKSRNVVKD